MGTSKRLRFRVLERDSFTCTYCGNTPSNGSVLHVDHVFPKASGGADTLENLVTSCADCNLGKADQVSAAAMSIALGDAGGSNAELVRAILPWQMRADVADDELYRLIGLYGLNNLLCAFRERFQSGAGLAGREAKLLGRIAGSYFGKVNRRCAAKIQQLTNNDLAKAALKHLLPSLSRRVGGEVILKRLQYCRSADEVRTLLSS